MTIIKIVEKKYKKEEVYVKNIIKEVIPRSFPALVLYLTVVILTLIGTLLVISYRSAIMHIYSHFIFKFLPLKIMG